MNSSLADRFVEVPSLADTLPQQGTMVIVANVFSSLPVRQRCINWQRETVGIRDWNTAFITKSTGRFCIIDKRCQVDVNFAGYRLVGVGCFQTGP